MNVIDSIDHIKSGMAEYFKRTFPVGEALQGVDDPSGLTSKLDAFLNAEDRFVKEPFVERQVPYAESANSLEALVGGDKAALDSDVATAFAKYLAGSQATAASIHPYIHQEESLKVVNDGKNLVICTGTGSGKTECFLLPVINAIVKERRDCQNTGKEYRNGVRAMILYPMNALVNDQVRRLRTVIRNLPEALRPTFGLYTGDLPTKEDHPDISSAANNLLHDWDSQSCLASGDGIAADEDDIPLGCEFRHRWEWTDRHRGPADILVTNYAMLERLLLLPETTPIFSSTWKFIVVDEAHSYTGSMGTEIAWLIRRVEKRVQGHGRLRFIATSATLRNGANQDENKQWIKDHFASKFFPASAETFEVKFGQKLETQSPVAASVNDAVYDYNIVALAQSDLFVKDTLGLLADEKTDNANQRLLPFVQTALDSNASGVVSANVAFHLVTSLPQIELSCPAVEITGNIPRMIKLAVDIIGGNDDDWKDKLHDPLDPRPGRRRTANGKPIYQGNRLQILDKWNGICNGENDIHKELSVEEFQYLYIWARRAAEEFETELNGGDAAFLNEQPRTALLEALDIGRYKVSLTEDFITKLSSFADETGEKHQSLVETREVLTEAWWKMAEEIGVTLDLLRGTATAENIIHAILARHRDVCALERFDFNKVVSLGSVAKAVSGNGDKSAIAQVNAVFQLGMVARKGNDRFPMFDIRYHVLARGLSDVALTFPDGDIAKLQLDQTTEPLDGERNIRFSLGACRKCGHPFILAYSDAQDLGDGLEHQLVREYTPRHRYLHALAWVCGNPIAAEDSENKQEPADEDTAVFVNLSTGKCSTADNNGWTRMVWVRHHQGEDNEHGGTRHISKCPNCGCRDDNVDAQYGIITPYDGSEKRVRIEMLKHFAITAEEDPSLLSMPGAGRKALAFSDTRNGAASLALDFDETYRRQLFGQLVVNALRNEIKGWDNPANQTTFENMLSADNTPQVVKEYFEGEFQRQHFVTLPKTIDVVARHLAQNSEWAYFMQVQNKTHPEEWLNIDNDASQWCVLEALRDLARYSLLKGRFVKVISRSIRDRPSHDLKFDAIDGLDNEQISVFNQNVRELYQTIYGILFKTCYIRLREDWPDVDDNTSWKVHYLTQIDNPNMDGVKNFHWSTQMKNCVIKYVRNQCKCSLLPDTIQMILQDIYSKMHDLGILTQDTEAAFNNASCLSGEQLLKDAIIEPNENATNADSEPINMPSLRIEEHTAQISPEQGRVYQSSFSSGKVNILSCSTTFEMGIDLGALNRVFLANMPPATANYKQRAGRAGRRPGAMPFILAYAGTSAHDRYFFDHPDKLFDGEVEPPRIYLEKPTFRARHLRAEMLHLFLVWWNSRRNGHAKWTKVNDFFVGYNFHRIGKKATGVDRRVIPLDEQVSTPVLDAFAGWLDGSMEDTRRAEAVCLADVPLDIGYNVANDLAFQLGVNRTVPPYDMGNPENHLNYLRLLGPNMPIRAQDGIGLEESGDPRRQCAKKRIDAKLMQYRDADVGSLPGYVAANDGSPCLMKDGAGDKQRFVTIRQRELLNEETISFLSSCNVLPKYGFPVDVIEMIPPANDLRAKTVRLQRDLKLGLYEYAPEQIVTADKRRFKSVGYFIGTNATPGTWYQCGNCHQLSTQDGDCPCGGRFEKVEENRFVRPSIFVSKLVHRSEFKPRGDNYTTYAGGIATGQEFAINGCRLHVAESDTQMMRFLNAGRYSAGFDVTTGEQPHKLNEPGTHQPGEILVHDIITNIVILTIPPACLPQEFVLDQDRTRNAVLSAMYAIREEVALRFRVVSRDIGAYLDDRSLSTVHHGKYSIVLFDNASGGGGLVLPLLDVNDSPIPEILLEAKKRCETCTGCGLDVINGNLKPVTEGEYRNEIQQAQEGNQMNVRIRSACPKCLKQLDHSNDAHLLDRFDAAKVLDLMLNTVEGSLQDTSTLDSEEIQWEPFNGHAVTGWPYRLRDGSVIYYECGVHDPQKFVEQAVETAE